MFHSASTSDVAVPCVRATLLSPSPLRRAAHLPRRRGAGGCQLEQPSLCHLCSAIVEPACMQFVSGKEGRGTTWMACHTVVQRKRKRKAPRSGAYYPKCHRALLARTCVRAHSSRLNPYSGFKVCYVHAYPGDVRGRGATNACAVANINLNCAWKVAFSLSKECEIRKSFGHRASTDAIMLL